MLDFADWFVWALGSIFCAAALVIGLAGTRVAAVADQLADRTGLGEAVSGAVFIGASTSLWASRWAYVLGPWLVRREREEPMWQPRMTELTRRDERDFHRAGSPTALWLRFAAYVPILLLSGIAIERSVAALAEQLGIASSVAGALATALPTSVPGLVIAVAAVRRGALTLAVGDVLGGNAFDTLFLAAADVGYRRGSVYHDAGPWLPLLTAMAILLTAVLLLGFLRRQQKGIANIGFESVLVLAGTAITYALLLLG